MHAYVRNSKLMFNYRYSASMNVKSKIKFTRVKMFIAPHLLIGKKLTFEGKKIYLINLSLAWKYKKRNVLCLVGSVSCCFQSISCNIIAFNIFPFRSVINCFSIQLVSLSCSYFHHRRIPRNSPISIQHKFLQHSLSVLLMKFDVPRSFLLLHGSIVCS